MQVALSPSDGEVTDEELADEIGVEVNEVRRTLIILNENGLADYRRVRDQESGWLTYLWTFRYERIPYKLKEEMEELRDSLEDRLEYERDNQFYRCQVCRQRYDFADAQEVQFLCPSCGNELESDEVEGLEELIEKRLAEINEELDKVSR
jgi:Transcription factor IIE (TFIIE), alpha subunit